MEHSCAERALHAKRIWAGRVLLCWEDPLSLCPPSPHLQLCCPAVNLRVKPHNHSGADSPDFTLYLHVTVEAVYMWGDVKRSQTVMTHTSELSIPWDDNDQLIRVSSSAFPRWLKSEPLLSADQLTGPPPSKPPSLHRALTAFFCLSANCHGNGCSPILLGSLCKWHLSLTVTGFKIILRAWRQVIKLNFRPVDHMNVLNEWWIKRAMGGGVQRGVIYPLSCKNTAQPACSASAFLSEMEDETVQVQALHWE